MKLFITGRPGTGKTTFIHNLAEQLTGLDVSGFYTEEIRRKDQRRGFRIVTFSGSDSVLAHVDSCTGPRVGRYRVNVVGFERLALGELRRTPDVWLIDEIGKMECHSAAFVTRVRELLDGPRPIVGTVAITGGGFIQEVKSRPDVEVIELTCENRGSLMRSIADRLCAEPGRSLW